MRQKKKGESPDFRGPEGLNALLAAASAILDPALDSHEVTGSPFCSGSLASCPSIRPAACPAGFPAPQEWKDADYAQVKPLLQQAPYGKGTETVIDKEVRNALEIAHDKLTIDDLPSWTAILNKAVLEAAAILAPALSPHGVRAELYKLVVYEEGGHFKPHRDTQRSETHFGTLVILLPGKATGGELVVRHGEKEETFNIPTGKKRCTYVAYFADVQHEVKPVTKGRRISILYHLHRQKSDPVVKPPAAASTSQSAALPPLVKSVKAVADELKKLLGGQAQPDASTSEPPAKKAKLGDESGKSKEKADESKAGVDPDIDDAPRFVGFICEHVYAGELTPEKLKGRDSAFYALLAPHFPGTRITHIEVRMYGPSHGDEASWVKSPADLSATALEVDEVNPKLKPTSDDKVTSRSWGGLSFSKTSPVSRLLFSSASGSNDYDVLDTPSNKVRFLNDGQDIFDVCSRARAAEKRTAGSGNEGSSGAFLYKKVAILVPLHESSEAFLGKFDANHAARSHPDFLP